MNCEGELGVGAIECLPEGFKDTEGAGFEDMEPIAPWDLDFGITACWS